MFFKSLLACCRQSITLVAAIIASSNLCVDAESVVIGGIEYEVNVGAGYASAVNGNEAVGDVVVRELVEYDGNIYPVTSIAPDFLNGNSSITSVSYPPGQWEIRIRDCQKLQSLNVYEGVVSFDLSNLPMLTNATFPSSLENVFVEGCGLSAISLSGNRRLRFLHVLGMNSLTLLSVTQDVEYLKISGNPALESLDLSGLTKLNYTDIFGCKSLKELYLGKSLRSYDGDFISGCPNLKEIIYDGSIADWCRIEFNGREIYGILHNIEYFWHSHGKSKLLYLKELNYRDFIGFDEIPDYSFAGYKGLTKVSLPASIKTIGKAAFADCSNLKYISIEAETIKKFAFYKVNDFDEFHFTSNLKLMISPFEDFAKGGAFPKVYYNGSLKSLCGIKRTSYDESGSATICTPNVLQLA